MNCSYPKITIFFKKHLKKLIMLLKIIYKIQKQYIRYTIIRIEVYR